jgi:ATP-dependent DNA helicase RecQ
LARHSPDYKELNEVYKGIQSLLSNKGTAEFRQLHDAIPQFSVPGLQVILKLLEDAGVLARDNQLDYRLINNDVKANDLVKLAETLGAKNAHDRNSLERMIFYAQSGFCRWKVLLECFPEEVEWDHCRHCDNCLSPPEKKLRPAINQSRHKSRRVKKPSPQPSFPAGAAVQVPKIGRGQVVSATDDMVTIVFSRQPNTYFFEKLREAGSKC